MRAIRKVIVHHTAGPDTATVADVTRAHVARGFGTIGYHHLIHRSQMGGPVWYHSAGRPESQVGAHDQGQNGDSIGVSIAGRYHLGPVPDAGWAVLVATVADVCRRYGLTADQVEGHRENEPSTTPTLCPGFDPEILRVAVRAALRS